MKPFKIIVLLVLLALVGLLAWRWTRPPPPMPARVVPSGPHEGRVTALGPRVSGDVFGRIVLRGENEQTWVAHDGALRAFAWVEGDLLSVGADSVARWGADGSLRGRYRLPEQLINDGVPVPGGIAVAGVRGSVAVLAEGKPRWEARGAHGEAATAVWFDGTHLYSGGGDGRVIAWDVATGEQAHLCVFDLGVIIALVEETDGVLVVARHGLARCGVAGGTVLAPWRHHPTSAARLGEVLAIGTEEGVIELRNPLDGKEIRTIETGETVLAVMLDERGLSTGGGADGEVRRWR